jgi:ankyrin repeat protein
MSKIFDILPDFNVYDSSIYSDPQEAFRDVIRGDKKRLMSYRGNLSVLRDYSGNNLLHVAVLVENINLIQYFLEYNMDPNLKNKANKTPWDLALRSQNKDIIKLFSEHECTYKELNNKLMSTNDSMRSDNRRLEDQKVELTKKNNTLENENTILRIHNKRLRDDVDTVAKENCELKDTNKRLKTSLDNMMKTFKK